MWRAIKYWLPKKYNAYPFYFSFLWALISIPLFPSCGDLKSPRDLNRLQNREEIEQRRRELEPLVGEYKGHLREARTDRKLPFRIIVVLSGEPVNNDGVPDETTAPTLSASVYYYLSLDENDSYITIPFNRSDYESSSGSIVFYSDDPEGSLKSEITQNHSQLSGKWFNSTRGFMGNFEVVKINQ